MADAVTADAAALSADPYAVYRQLRNTGPCVWLEAAHRHVIPRWREVFDLDQNPAFVAGDASSLMNRTIGRTMLRADGDDHLRQRRAAHAPLRWRGFEARWGGMLDRAADELLDGLVERGSSELVSEFAGPFAARTLKALLGLDAVDDHGLERASQALIEGIGNYEDDPEVWTRCAWANELIDRSIDAAWNHAGEGTVLRSLISASTLTEAEIRANVKLFVSGGLNEPRDVIATAVWALLSDPEQEALVREDPANCAPAVEESLRWMSPIGMYPRLVVEDTAIGDVELSAGSSVGVLIASANRDERRWTEPDRFDLRRGSTRHLAFSRGPHVCLGAFIARQQIGVAALPALFARLPRLRLAADFEPRLHGWVFRGLSALSVEWDA